MSVNTMSVEQVFDVVNEMQEQVTGQKSIAPVNTSEFVSVANTLLQIGYDPILNSINQMISRTIFSIRPYYRKFADLQVSNQKFGAHTRKLQMIDRPFENNLEWDLTDGESIDHYKINKPKVLQTNFYGMATYCKRDTTFRDQLDNAFTGPEQLGEFLSMKYQNVLDQIEQAHEDTARATIANFIAGKIAADNGVIHCLTEYNEHTGQSLTDITVYAPENFKPFIEWLYARVEQLSEQMTERSGLFQIQINGSEINRHTPRADQRIYMYSPLKAEIDKRVLTNEFHDNYLKLAKNESVNFWQSILDTMKVEVTPVYLGTDGNLVTAAEAVSQDKIIGVMFDRDAMGYTVVNQWNATTPLNIDGGYWNTSWHFTERYWNDFNEKGIVLVLD